MKLKAIAVLAAVAAFAVMPCCAYAHSGAAVVVREDFALIPNGASPSTDWVIDFAAGADIADGALLLSGGDKAAGASYEIPVSVQKSLAGGVCRISISLVCENAGEYPIISVEDGDGNTLCSVNGTQISGDSLVIEISHADRCYIINPSENSEAKEYMSADAAVIRFCAADGAEIAVKSLVIETENDNVQTVAYTGFSDVSVHRWSARYINRLAAGSIMVGEDNRFMPEALITKAQAASVLCRIFGIDTAGGEYWYSGAMSVLGIEGSPDEPVMRMDICNMAAGLLKRANRGTDEYTAGKFADIDALDAETRENVLMLAEMSVISGVSETEFEPYSYLTREQAARIFCGLLDVMEL